MYFSPVFTGSNFLFNNLFNKIQGLTFFWFYNHLIFIHSIKTFPEKTFFHVFPRVFHEVFPEKSDFFPFIFEIFRKMC